MRTDDRGRLVIELRERVIRPVLYLYLGASEIPRGYSPEVETSRLFSLV